MGRLDDALAVCKQIIQLNPCIAESHNNPGVTLRRKDLFNEAKASYLKALEVNPDYTEAHTSLGNLLKDRGLLEDAARHYRRALELAPVIFRRDFIWL